jgi:transcriptional regulator with XRE-family HTH domain
MTRPAGLMVSPFGARLRQWRRRRGISQLRLAAEVGSTPRYISFLETGRSRPSREMVGRLGAALGVSLREQKQLLHAAGVPAAYPQAQLGDPDLAAFRAAIDRLLEAHLPYPALVVDGRWNVVAANRACAPLFGGDLVGANMIRRYFGDRAAAEWMVNWAEVAWAGLGRLRQQLQRTPFDEELRALVGLAEAAVADLPRPAAPGAEPVVCPWFRVGDNVIRTIGMVARFDAAADVTLDELRVELTYPQDAAAERFFREQDKAHQ